VLRILTFVNANAEYRLKNILVYLINNSKNFYSRKKGRKKYEKNI